MSNKTSGQALHGAIHLALTKPEGDIRPIGNTLRRLAGKICMKSLSDSVICSLIFSLHQMGIGMIEIRHDRVLSQTKQRTPSVYPFVWQWQAYGRFYRN